MKPKIKYLLLVVLKGYTNGVFKVMLLKRYKIKNKFKMNYYSNLKKKIFTNNLSNNLNNNNNFSNKQFKFNLIQEIYKNNIVKKAK